MKEFGLKGLLDRYEGADAIFKISDGRTISLPKELAAGLQVGEPVQILALPDRADTPAHEALAREMLNRLISKHD